MKQWLIKWTCIGLIVLSAFAAAVVIQFCVIKLIKDYVG
jgi:hypothetical protein